MNFSCKMIYIPFLFYLLSMEREEENENKIKDFFLNENNKPSDAIIKCDD